jgi:uncharacterized protein YjbI with pentapeptide repeats
MNFNAEIKEKLYGESFKKASEQEIIEEVQLWKGLQVTVFWENLREIKKALLLQHQKLDFAYFIFSNFESQKLKEKKAFNFWEEQEEVSFFSELSFYKAKFIGNINFKATLFKEEVNFSNSTFYEDANFNQTIFLKKANFTKAQFKDEALFYNVHFKEKVLFDESGFHGRTVFHECKFNSEASFSLVSSKYRITFFSCHAKRISFKYSRINHAYFVKNNFKYLNLHGIAIQIPFFSDNEIKEAERETFAYIKHFFDKGDDYISANYYYAKEMQSYQRKLFPRTNASFFKKIYHWFSKENLGEKVVFGFSKVASNFGQNIFLPLYWILFAGALFVGVNTKESVLFIAFSLLLLVILILSTSLLRKITKQPKREDLIWLLAHASISLIAVGLWLNEGQFISDFAKVINPVQILKSKDPYCQGIELSCLLLRVFIATMVYHFIIASKRGVKR